MAIERKALLRDYGRALRERTAALFVGAGMSRPAGLSDWRELLRDVADDLKLDIDRETDLIAVAQFHANTHGNRGRINQLLIDEFTKDAKITENHRLIAELPLRTIWTTNYDTLLEDASKSAAHRPDVKHTTEQLAVTRPRADVTILKMHGDISRADEAVLTKDDYEAYNVKRLPFTEALKGDLITKTFLFLGFSFTDPNIDYILSRIRILLDNNQRQHFCIMKRPEQPKPSEGAAKADYEYELRKLDLRVEDLKRFGIQTLLIDDYTEITDILRELNKLSHTRDVFVSGSAHEYGAMPKERLDALARTLGSQLILRDYNLISGFGLGVGGAVIMGAFEAIYADDNAMVEDRTILRPFPQVVPTGMTREEFNSKYRHDMLSKAGHCVFLSGNKLDNTTGKVIAANGVREEFKIAKALGKTLVPVGATGYMALELWTEMNVELSASFPGKDVSADFAIIGDSARSNEDIIDAVFRIIKTVGG